MLMSDGRRRFARRYEEGRIKIWLGRQTYNQAGWYIMKFNVGPLPRL